MDMLTAGSSAADSKIVTVSGYTHANLGPVLDGHHAKISDWYLFWRGGHFSIGQVAQIRDHGHQVRFVGDGRWLPVAGMTALGERR